MFFCASLSRIVVCVCHGVHGCACPVSADSFFFKRVGRILMCTPNPYNANSCPQRRDRRTFLLPPLPLWFSPVVCPPPLLHPASLPPVVGWSFLLPSLWLVVLSPLPLVGSLVSSHTSEALFHRKNVVNSVTMRNSKKSCFLRLAIFEFQGAL